jgi:phage tail P2-like protein
MWKTIEIVPSSIRDDPQVQAACGAIDAELVQIADEFLQGSPKANPSICFWPDVEQQVEPLLDVLSWEMHVDVWQNIAGAPLTTEKKIELINQSIDWHRHKGTKYAVDQMLKTVFGVAMVTEWYEYGGDPYYFRIVTEEHTYTEAELGQILDAVYAVKNVRSWLDSFDKSRLHKQFLYQAIVVRQFILTKIPMGEE